MRRFDQMLLRSGELSKMNRLAVPRRLRPN